MIRALIYSFTIFIFIFALQQPETASAQSFSSPTALDDFLWSSNIGWISLNCSNDSSCASDSGNGLWSDYVDYEVVINPDYTITGYAWSSNIGWIKFGGLTGCPSGSCDARLSSDKSEVLGWARACAATASGCSGALDPDAGGWDGWISLNSDNHSGSNNYGVSVNNGSLGGYAWGSDVIGWISFSGTGYGANFTSPCTADLICSIDSDSYVLRNQWCEDSSATTCGGGEYCINSSGCEVVTIDGSITASQVLINQGRKVFLDWNANSSQASSCEVNGNNNDSWTGLSGSNVETSALRRSMSVFTLSCVPPGGNAPIDVDSVEINLVPSMIES